MKNVKDFVKGRDPITMVTCYDSTSAAIVAASKVDCVLVGDSVAMTMHGYRDTLMATVSMISLHVSAVRRGAPETFIVADMPFLAHRGSLDYTLSAVQELMRAGANAIKIEGVDGSESTLQHIVQSGVPVMGHLGLTPQSVHALGGFKVQGRNEEQASQIEKQAKRLEELGVFALVLECVPQSLAAKITQSLRIPTIGIGAGNQTDGQVLVLQDLLGMNPNFKPKFVRSFANGAEWMRMALNDFVEASKTRNFPNREESFES